MTGALRIRDITWLAGLMEGEGCFTVRLNKQHARVYKQPIIQLMMTDADPVMEAARIMKCKMLLCTTVTSTGKALYRINVCGALAMGWMMTLYALLSPRRQKAIRACLEAWRSSNGKTHTARYLEQREVYHRRQHNS